MANTRSKKTSNRQSQKNNQLELLTLELGGAIREAVVNRDEYRVLFLKAYVLGSSECITKGEGDERLKEYLYKWTNRLINEVGRDVLFQVVEKVALRLDDETLGAVFIDVAFQIISAFPSSKDNHLGKVFYEGGVFYVPR